MEMANGEAKKKEKLHGRAFYESIGSPKFVLAPMVDQSEFAWRMLTRSFMPESAKDTLLAYSPMMHARMFGETKKFRDAHFQPLRSSLPTAKEGEEDKIPFLDGNPKFDRPLFVQFCANDPDELLEAARHVAPFCDAVDLNLGCPQGIARKGKYGAFLQEDQELIYRLVNKLHKELEVPVTAKIRVLESKEKTLEYARNVVKAGASILTIHGRTREMKGHKTGLADWGVIRWVRKRLQGDDVVVFANGNVLRKEDVEACLKETGVDGVMSAEGNLYDPAIFAEDPAVGEEGREFWRGRDGKGGWRMDAVFRTYMDVMYKYVLEIPAPDRTPLYLPSDPEPEISEKLNGAETGTKRPLDNADPEQPPKKRPRKEVKKEKTTSPNLLAMQPHLFHLLRPLVAKHHNVRDALARCRAGDIAAFENVLALTETAVREGLREYEITDGASWERELGEDERLKAGKKETEGGIEVEMEESSVETVRLCKRPWWVVQPYVRPLPKEALAKGSLTLSRKEREMLEKEKAGAVEEKKVDEGNGIPNGHVEHEKIGDGEGKEEVEIPKEGLVCG
ncbi:FMN-linked oxidoreductase [Mollisia scopiformis]|uniref:tRNA-dihydrouridine(16/17) synthase [NAD(P)(+)] n=1 Tax=Mollisia scopiformis TaxID=149040 RepID=A0A194WYM0_MOLSC|nr:FMN-linked oxidoreductase [Mollisia scopiformis]KUJ12784.1 FMN-linked oxidoreductase [Mollisia scopiformis]